ncbi:MAG: phospholipid carrier-dependent glycosyltransferase [Ardenticatenales bacterium]|nr:phospholipid carrier-dependent glycosyltransferase [Ardenticatenales bacterium]
MTETPESSTIPPATSRYSIAATSPLWLALIVVLAALLRFGGLNWDRHIHHHPDERFLTMVISNIGWPSSPANYFDESASPLSPRNYTVIGGDPPQEQRPYSLWVYGDLPLTIVKGTTVMLDKLLPLERDISWSGYDYNYMVARVLNGLFDLGTLVLLFLIARRLYKSHWLALGAALLYALSVLPIQHAHFWVVDTMTVFFATATIYWLARIYDSDGIGHLSDYLGAGFLFGMALATKVSIATMALLFVALAALKLWQGLRDPQVDSGKLLSQIIIYFGSAAFMGLIAFRLFQPYAFSGIFTPAERWLANLRDIQCQVNGQCDVPFGHQWANRTPYLFPWKNAVLWGLGLPLGIAATIGWGAAAWQIVRRQRWAHLLPVLWVLVLFAHQGGQWVKSMRYLLPIYPMLALLAAWLAHRLWQRAQRLAMGPWQANALRVVVATLFVGTALYAAAFTNVYRNDHTHIQATEWLYANAPAGSGVALEHWDEYLPRGWPGAPPAISYNWIELLWYNEDTPDKLEEALGWFDRADYIITVSNRLYGGTSRLPARFPMTNNYYAALFDGSLGFERVANISEGPTLFGIELDDQFDRTGPGWLGIDWDEMLAAEEAFSVYDHPRVQIFQKTAAYDRETARAILSEGVDWNKINRMSALQWTESGGDSQTTGLPLLSERDRAIYEAGGTWSAIFDRASFANRAPLLVWALLLELLGLLALPWLLTVMPQMPGRGYAFAKPLGLLLVGWLSWLLASLRVVPFTMGGIGLAAAIIGIGSLLLGLRLLRGRSLATWLRRDGRALLRAEVVFWLFFALVLLIRWANPDIWHPQMGGERPMDFSYLNATIKSTYFPPMDPWFAGGTINYYYFGFVLVAVLIKVSGIVPAVAYNLVVPTLYAALAAGVWAVAWALLANATRRGRYAALAALFVAVIGNLGELKVVRDGLVGLSDSTVRTGLAPLDTLIRMGDGLLNGVILGGQQLAGRPEWPYWNATRVIESAQINEFPWFTFLYADLHAHMMALPYTALALGLAVALLFAQRRGWLAEALHLFLLALVIGALWPMNTWDFPTYGLVAFAGLGLRAWARDGRITLDGLLGTLWRWGLVILLARLLFQPFHSHYATGYSSIERWRGEITTLGEFLTIHGFFLWLIAFMLGADLLFGRGHNSAVRRLRFALKHGRRSTRWATLSPASRAALAVAALAAVLALLIAQSWSAPVGVALLLLIPALLLFFRAEPQPLWQMALFMVIVGLALVIVVELVVLTGDVGRMNTVFKFYLQVWLLWGIAAAIGMAQIAPTLARWSGPWRWLWRGSVALLFAITLLYPIFSTYAKINDRFDRSVGPTLDGMAFMEKAIYNGPRGPLPLSDDAAAIRWLQENVSGSPTVAEMVQALYNPSSRITMYTGNPSIVGWDWHQRQQRAASLPGQVEQRGADVQQLYNSPDATLAQQILTRYGVDYIVVGGWEKANSSPEGIAKFAANDGVLWDEVYNEANTQIYRVRERAAP